MRKYKIKVVKLGSQRYDYVYNQLKKYKSQLFEIEISEKADLPNADLAWAYSTEKLKEIIMPCNDPKNFDMCIGFLDYPIENNYYGRNLENNEVFVVSFFQTAEILMNDNIDLLNFIVMTIYRYLTRHIINDRIVHDETKGCMNDMCGIKSDIIFSCRKPILCVDCESKLRKMELPEEYISQLKHELKKIKKALYYKIGGFIKKHPIASLIIGAIFTIMLNIFSSWIFSLF